MGLFRYRAEERQNIAASEREANRKSRLDAFLVKQAAMTDIDTLASDFATYTAANDTAVSLKLDAAKVGVVNGVAPLGADSKIASAYLPSYVDDVLEYATFAALPTVGETGKIYVVLATNYEYRWSGSAYIQLVASPGSTDAVPEGTTNKYWTAARTLATALTGMVTTNTAVVAATDTILIAIGKLQAQLSANSTADAGKVAKAGDTMTGPLVFPSYAKAALPVAATYARGIIWVSDLTGGAAHCYSDGTSWRRMADGSTVN